VRLGGPRRHRQAPGDRLIRQPPGDQLGHLELRAGQPFVIDASKFEAVFGRLEPTRHRDAVQRTVA
jgi:hypothetical protein